MPYIQTSKCVVIAFAFVVVGFARVYACSCGPQPPLLESFDRSELVVATRLAAVTPYTERTTEDGLPMFPTATMVVEKVYKGNLRVGEELTFGFGGSSCDVFYSEADVNSRFLFYLGKPTSTNPRVKPIYRQTVCERPSRFTRAVADLAYLDNLEKYRGRTRISGMLLTDAILFEAADKTLFPSVEGVAITFISGKKSFKTRSTTTGMFELYDLPPGEYKFHATLPKGWKLNDQPFTIRAKQQSELQPLISADTRISGRVISSTGKPIEEISVKAIPIDRIMTINDPNIGVSTDKYGRFEIDNLLPGRYKIVVNGNYPFDYRDAHYGTAYYPGVDDESNAAVISVELGKPVRGIDIKMSPEKESVEIGGVVKYSDGTLANGATVIFSSDSQEEGTSDAQGKTDKFGRFSLRVLKGVNGSILVLENNDSSSSLTGCHETRIKKNPVTGYTEFVSIKNLEINTSKPATDLVLTFPFASCPKP